VKAVEVGDRSWGWRNGRKGARVTLQEEGWRGDSRKKIIKPL
jgi:hypothetical protein